MGDGHEVVCKHGCTDQDLEAVASLGQTSLHASAAKEHGDAALNACPKALSFFELRALFERLLWRGPFTTSLRNADELHISARFDVLIAEKASVRTVPSGSQTESLLMTLQGRLDVDMIGGIALKHAVLGDQTAGTFSEKDLVAKLDRFLYFPPLDQIGVGFKNRVDLLIGWNLFSLKHAAPALIDDAVAELAVVIDLSSKLANDQVVHQVKTALIFCLFKYPSGIVDDLLGDPDELAIFVLLPIMPLPRGHALDLLHPTPRRACAVRKIIDPVGKNLFKTTDEPRENSQSLTVLHSQIDGRFKDQVVEGLQGLRPKFVKGPMESVVLRYALAIKTREPAQRVPVGDALAQFPIVPVLHPHQDQRPKHLRRGHGRAARVRLFQTSLKILADPLHDLGLMIEEIGNPLENRVEINALDEKLDIGEVDLGVCDSCHFLTF